MWLHNVLAYLFCLNPGYIEIILDVQTFQFSNSCIFSVIVYGHYNAENAMHPLSSTLVYIDITHLTDTVSAQ